MKTSLFYILAAIAALIAPSAAVRAQDVPASATVPEASVLTDADFQPYSQAAGDPAYSTVLCGSHDTNCCCALPRLEVNATLLYLQPGAGNLEYGTLVSPLPAPSPHWLNQSISPNFSPAFNVGMRYLVPETCNDIRSSWTHLDSTDSNAFAGDALNFAGPSYLIGPGATAFNVGNATVNFKYDAFNFEAGHLWRAGPSFQVRTFGGLQYGSVTEKLTGFFSDLGNTISQSNITHSQFRGLGPRFGVNGQFNRGNFQFVGDMAAVALIGQHKSRMDFDTISAMFPGGNPQLFSSPNSTKIVPGIDSRLGTAYSFQLGRGICKLEAGYQAVVYLDAINSYTLTQVATPPVVGGVGVFFATAEHLQSNFIAHGPYMSASWAF